MSRPAVPGARPAAKPGRRSSVHAPRTPAACRTPSANRARTGGPALRLRGADTAADTPAAVGRRTSTVLRAFALGVGVLGPAAPAPDRGSRSRAPEADSAPGPIPAIRRAPRPGPEAPPRARRLRQFAPAGSSVGPAAQSVGAATRGKRVRTAAGPTSPLPRERTRRRSAARSGTRARSGRGAGHRVHAAGGSPGNRYRARARRPRP